MAQPQYSARLDDRNMVCWLWRQPNFLRSLRGVSMARASIVRNLLFLVSFFFFLTPGRKTLGVVGIMVRGFSASVRKKKFGNMESD